MKYTLNDIPDYVTSKKFLPIARHFYRLLKELGWDYLANNYDQFIDLIYSELNARFDETLIVANKVVEGQIENPDKIMTILMTPPVLVTKSNLQQGTARLLFGHSIDVAFVSISDFDKEILFIFNCHMENGLPDSYFWVPHEDETLLTRHPKMGVELKDIPKKVNFIEAGYRTIDILKTIRNELTPEYSSSDLVVCNYSNMGGINLSAEISNWNSCANLWDGINTKFYGLPDEYFLYIPWPPILKNLFELPRNIWNTRMTSLLSRNHLFLGYIINYNDFRDQLPEGFDVVIGQQLREGIPPPKQTLECKIPNFKKKNYDFTFPEGKRITPDDLNLNEDAFLTGVFTNITHETPQDHFDQENIISLGHGEQTKILK